MKDQLYRIVVIVGCVLCSIMSYAQTDFAPEIAKIVVGDVLFQSPKTVTFAFKNKGKKAFQIQKVIPSCGCTTAEWTQGSIEPGKVGVITAVYDAKMLGTFYKELAVYTTASPEPAYLSMEGRVVTDLIDFTGDFPIDLGSLRINTNYVEFDNVNRGDHPIAEFQVANMTHDPYRPELMHLPDYLTFQSYPEVIAAGRTGRIQLMLNSEKLGLLGLNQTRIFLSRFPGDKVSETNEILVSAVLLPNFSKLTEEQLAKAPQIKFSTEEVDFGSLTGKSKKQLKQEVIVSNEGQEPLEIRSVQVFNQALSVSLDKRVIAPGSSTKMKISINEKFLKKAKNRPRVLLITNDPQRPSTRINVSVEQ